MEFNFCSSDFWGIPYNPSHPENFGTLPTYKLSFCNKTATVQRLVIEAKPSLHEVVYNYVSWIKKSLLYRKYFNDVFLIIVVTIRWCRNKMDENCY